jgi:hypothetical protein
MRCASAGLGAANLLGASSAGLTRIAAAYAIATPVGSGGGDPDGSAGGMRPVNPAPGPAPGGSSGGSAMGGSGFGLSFFLTLAGLLLFAAPRAMRRLRLSSLSWRTSFLVLIPERPD